MMKNKKRTLTEKTDQNNSLQFNLKNRQNGYFLVLK